MALREPQGERNGAIRDTGPVSFRLCLSISGLRCASEAAPLERALKKIDGVRDATVNPLRDSVSLEVDALTRVGGSIAALAARGYAVAAGDISVTTWLPVAADALEALRRELLAMPAVTWCAVASATGRVEVRLAMSAGWEAELRAVCDRLCAAASAARSLLRFGSRTAGRTRAGSVSGARSRAQKG